MKKNFSKILSYIILISLLVSAIIIWTKVFSKPDDKLHVWFFDVGQGDSEFIQAPGGTQVLIDGGPSSKVLSELGEVMPYNDRFIDFVMITHPDADHITGLVDVLERYNIGEIIYTGVEHPTAVYKQLLAEIDNKNISKKIGFAGISFNLAPDCFISIIYPTRSYQGKKEENLNNTSLVSKLLCEGKKFLFTGDVEIEAQKKLINSTQDLSSDVLKVSHHGAKNATLGEFIDAVKPEYAIISVGENNRYGHPAKEVIQMLKSFKIYRTDQDGRIEIKVENRQLEIYKRNL